MSRGDTFVARDPAGNPVAIPVDANGRVGVTTVPATAPLPPSAPNIAVINVTVGIAVDLLIAARATRRVLYIQNNGGAAVVIGPTGVALASGFTIPAGGFREFASSARFDAISGTAGQDVRVMEVFD